ncbi:MAG: hypothetical protein NWE93_02370 [Candidatus Bathyarchaeota archaeon]|nr:hypothetical protein [Candidatus Bathyarchaeota archaeon]
MQNLTFKPALTRNEQPALSLNMPLLDGLFPGFSCGDFAVLYGSRSVTSLTSLLCVRAQLPVQLGGLASSVVFIDGGVTFRLYNVARLAQLYQLNPEGALKKIYISRAFTAYQLTALIMERLEQAVAAYNAKVVVISDLAGFFLDNNIAAEEAQRIYSQLATYLANFARQHQIALIATYLPHQGSKRESLLQEVTAKYASTVLRFTKTSHGKEVALEKHPTYKLGSADLSAKKLALTDFMGGGVG